VAVAVLLPVPLPAATASWSEAEAEAEAGVEEEVLFVMLQNYERPTSRGSDQGLISLVPRDDVLSPPADGAVHCWPPGVGVV
jgi:hypothetical protein